MMVRYSPFDLRFFLRLVIVLTVWKFLSYDYSALASMANFKLTSHLMPQLDALVDTWKPVLFGTVWKIHFIQLSAAALLLLAAWRLNRILLLLGLAGLAVFEWTVSQYRGPLFDIEAACVFLLLASLWPGSWRVLLSGGPTVTRAATRLGFTFALYIATAYFLTGLSKVLFHPQWWQEIHLENLYSTMVILHNTRMPGFLDSIARFHQALFQRFPGVGVALAAFALVLELAWGLALFFRPCRRLLPPLMLGTHIGIFLASGIFFFPFPVVTLGSVVAWRRLVDPLELSYDESSPTLTRLARTLQWLGWFGRIRAVSQPPLSETAPSTAEEVGSSGLLATDRDGQYGGLDALLHAALRCPLLTLPAALLLLPGIRWSAHACFGRLFRSHKSAGSDDQLTHSLASFQRFNPFPGRPLFLDWVWAPCLLVVLLALAPERSPLCFPFLRYGVFGWSYASYSSRLIVHRFGYIDPGTGRPTPLPMNHGGFMDYTIVPCPDYTIKAYLEAKAKDVDQRAALLQRLTQFQASVRPHRSYRWLLGYLACPPHVVSTSQPVPADQRGDLRLLRGVYDPESGYEVDWEDFGRLSDLRSRVEIENQEVNTKDNVRLLPQGRP